MTNSKTRFVGLHLALTMAYEARLQPTIRRQLSATYKSAAREYEKGNGASGIRKALEGHRSDVYYILGGIYAKAIPAYGRLIIRQIKTAVPNYETKSSLSGNSDNFFINLASSWILQEGLKRASSISDTTLDDINRILDNGLQQGLSIPEISKDIRGLSGEFSSRRAKTIAITEVHNASMFASVQTAKATELSLIKEWASVEDSRVRPSHAAADGQQREMNDKFTIGGARMDRPGDPTAPAAEVINCRCTLLYNEKEYQVSEG